MQPSEAQKSRRRGTKFKRKPSKELPYTLEPREIPFPDGSKQLFMTKVYRQLTYEEILDPEYG